MGSDSKFPEPKIIRIFKNFFETEISLLLRSVHTDYPISLDETEINRFQAESIPQK